VSDAYQRTQDKWRNLKVQSAKLEQPSTGRGSDVPPAVLERVRALAASPPPAAARSADDSEAAEPSLRRSKHHTPWSLDETRALIAGVARAGGCRWSQIKAQPELVDGVDPLAQRSALDLKDKFRNCVALAKLPASSRRKHETPGELLEAVLQLEAKFGAAKRRARPGSAGREAEEAAEAEAAEA